MLAVKLNGGLGNQLFQLAAGETIATETDRTFCILDTTSPTTVHTKTNYFDSILSNWTACPRLPTPYANVTERTFAKPAWKELLPADLSVCLHGYFQNWAYIPSTFSSRLQLPACPSLEGAFLHIRGGDYVNHWFHDVGLARGYYEKAVLHFPEGTHFYIFTNDVPYAKSLPVLNTIPHTFVDSDDMSSLAQMAACTKGGICANSSFSWWGAYLNPTRTIVMPDVWFNDPTMYTAGYYFPGVRVCPV
jgi:hypothetical protein